MQYTIHCRLQCRLPLHSSDSIQIHCRGTLHVHFSLCSVVAVYTVQSMQSMYSVHCSYLELHCMYTALRSGFYSFLLPFSYFMCVHSGSYLENWFLATLGDLWCNTIRLVQTHGDSYVLTAGYFFSQIRIWPTRINLQSYFPSGSIEIDHLPMRPVCTGLKS